jgi:hypothetical protein
MKHLVLCLVLSCPSTALAMNWEGHDDWMLHAFPEFTLEALVPGARPLPSPECPVTHEQAAKNPYEQIPLPHHRCPGRPEKAEPRR